MISTYGNSCIQKLPTPRSQRERKRRVAVRNATNDSSANRKQSQAPQIHSRCENKALRLRVFGPFAFEYCTVFLVSTFPDLYFLRIRWKIRLFPDLILLEQTNTFGVSWRVYKFSDCSDIDSRPHPTAARWRKGTSCTVRRVANTVQ